MAYIYRLSKWSHCLTWLWRRGADAIVADVFLFKLINKVHGTQRMCCCLHHWNARRRHITRSGKNRCSNCSNIHCCAISINWVHTSAEPYRTISQAFVIDSRNSIPFCYRVVFFWRIIMKLSRVWAVCMCIRAFCRNVLYVNCSLITIFVQQAEKRRQPICYDFRWNLKYHIFCHFSPVVAEQHFWVSHFLRKSHRSRQWITRIISGMHQLISLENSDEKWFFFTVATYVQRYTLAGVNGNRGHFVHYHLPNILHFSRIVSKIDTLTLRNPNYVYVVYSFHICLCISANISRSNTWEQHTRIQLEMLQCSPTTSSAQLLILWAEKKVFTTVRLRNVDAYQSNRSLWLFV